MTGDTGEQATGRVRIETVGVSVEVEAAAPLADLVATARGLFDHATHATQPAPGGAVGFVAERRDTPPAQPSSMSVYPHPYPTQPVE